MAVAHKYYKVAEQIANKYGNTQKHTALDLKAQKHKCFSVLVFSCFSVRNSKFVIYSSIIITQTN